MNTQDCRLIEDCIPIREISVEASPEKSIRKGHIPDEVGQNEPPTEEELRILREEVDPEWFYI